MDTRPRPELGPEFIPAEPSPYGPAVEPPPEPTPGDLLVQAAIRRGPTNFAALDRADEARTRALQARERGEASLKTEDAAGADEQFALERTHQSRANYWFKKAYKLNTNAGVKQLIRGGTAREVKAKYEAQRAALEGAARTAEREAERRARMDTVEHMPAGPGSDPVIELQIETLPEAKRSVLNRLALNKAVSIAFDPDPLDLALGLV